MIERSDLGLQLLPAGTVIPRRDLELIVDMLRLLPALATGARDAAHRDALGCPAVKAHVRAIVHGCSAELVDAHY